MLPAIIGAITGIPALIDAGKALVESFTGEPSKATDAVTLQAEVEKLPPDKQEAWAKAMEAKVAMHQSENQRLSNEQGEVTPDLLQQLDPETRRDVVLYRMTTRPRVVRWMAFVILLPPMTIVNDIIVLWVQSMVRAFGSSIELPMLATTIFGPNSVYQAIYAMASEAAMTIVMSYMILYTFEKRGTDVLGKIGEAMGGLRNLLKRK